MNMSKETEIKVNPTNPPIDALKPYRQKLIEIADSIQYEEGLNSVTPFFKKVFSLLVGVSPHNHTLSLLGLAILDFFERKLLIFRCIPKDMDDEEETTTNTFFDTQGPATKEINVIAIYSTSIKNDKQSILDVTSGILHESLHMIARAIKQKDKSIYESIFDAKNVDEFYEKISVKPVNLKFSKKNLDTYPQVIKLFSEIRQDLLGYHKAQINEECLTHLSEALFLETALNNFQSKEPPKNFLNILPIIAEKYKLLNTEIAALISPECFKKNPWMDRFNNTLCEEKAESAFSFKKPSKDKISDSHFCFLPDQATATKKSKSVDSSLQTNGLSLPETQKQLLGQ